MKILPKYLLFGLLPWPEDIRQLAALAEYFTKRRKKQEPEAKGFISSVSVANEIFGGLYQFSRLSAELRKQNPDNN